MAARLALSVLDQSTAALGRPESDAIAETLALARTCDALGYRRYWLSEHHNSGSIVGTAPEILIAAIAATTKKIRVGSAGVMLPHYSALKVAEQFRVLEAIAPGRIDLGLGRAPGTDRTTAFALNPGAGGSPHDFPQQLVELMRWLDGAPFEAGHPFSGVVAHPRGATSPEVWMLGSSNYGAQLAAHLGLPYAYAYFFSDGRGVEEALALYRDNYRPSEGHSTPRATVCIWALAADTEEQAWRLFSTREHWRVGFEQGVRNPLVPPEHAASHRYTAAEQALIERLRAKAFVGNAAGVASKLDAEARRLGLDELVIVTWTYDAGARRRSYELLADAFALRAP